MKTKFTVRELECSGNYIRNQTFTIVIIINLMLNKYNISFVIAVKYIKSDSPEHWSLV